MPKPAKRLRQAMTKTPLRRPTDRPGLSTDQQALRQAVWAMLDRLGDSASRAATTLLHVYAAHPELDLRGAQMLHIVRTQPFGTPDELRIQAQARLLASRAALTASRHAVMRARVSVAQSRGCMERSQHQQDEGLVDATVCCGSTGQRNLAVDAVARLPSA
jgi:hypothetical protein